MGKLGRKFEATLDSSDFKKTGKDITEACMVYSRVVAVVVMLKWISGSMILMYPTEILRKMNQHILLPGIISINLQKSLNAFNRIFSGTTCTISIFFCDRKSGPISWIPNRIYEWLF